MESEMELAVERHSSGVHLVALRGELHGDDGGRLGEQVHPLLADRGSSAIVDLSGLKTLDSGGLSQLIGLNTHARMCGARVILAGPTPFVAGVLQVTQLDKWFEMAESVAAAEARLRDTPAGA